MRTFHGLAKLVRKPALRQGTAVLVDQGALTLATFVAGVLVARANSKEDYGIYVLGWSVLLIFLSIQRALVNLPFTVYAPRLDQDDLAKYQGSTLIHTAVLCVFSVLILLMAYVFAAEMRVNDAITLWSSLPWLMVLVVPVLLREYVRNSLLAALKVRASLGVSMLATLFLVSIVVAFYIAEKLSVRMTYQVIAVVYVLAIVLMVWNHRNDYRFEAKRFLPEFLMGWPLARWALIDVLAYTAASQAYPWLLLMLSDYQAVAAYGACLAAASLLTPFLRGMSAYVMPRMAHGHKGNNPANLMRLLRLSLLVLSIPYALWLTIGAVFSTEIMTLLYGDTYSEFGVLFILLLLRVVIASVSSPFESALQTLERADINTASLIIGGIVTVGAGFVLIKYFGLVGAGLAGVISAIATMLWRWFFIRKVFSITQARKVAGLR